MKVKHKYGNLFEHLFMPWSGDIFVTLHKNVCRFRLLVDQSVRIEMKDGTMCGSFTLFPKFYLKGGWG